MDKIKVQGGLQPAKSPHETKRKDHFGYRNLFLPLLSKHFPSRSKNYNYNENDDPKYDQEQAGQR